ECSLPNCPQSRVSVADAGTEKEVEDSRENRVANVAVLPWHCAGRNAALEARAHAKIGAITKLADHLDAVEEIVAPVRVAHQQIFAMGLLAAADQSSAISSIDHADYTCAQPRG